MRGNSRRCRFDPLRGRSSPLVRYHLRFELRPLQLGLVRHGVNFVVRGSVMRQHHQRIIVFLLAEPLDMRGKRLALRLVVVEHAYFAADELRNPDYRVIGLRTSTADIPECFKRKQRISVAF